MKKVLMIGLPVLCGTFAAFGQYMKRRFSSLEICLLHIIVALIIPTLFIGCGPPVGALFDDTSKVQLPSESEVITIDTTLDEMLQRELSFHYVSIGGMGRPPADKQLYVDYVQLCFLLIQEVFLQPITFRLTDNANFLYEGDIDQIMTYLQISWGQLWYEANNGRGQALAIECIHHPVP
jgi:hypothetical protein